MPKLIPNEELDAIAKVVAGHPDGVGVEGIRERLSFGLPPRTLQRRLTRLEEDGRIRSTGSGKGTRYFPATSAAIGEIAKPGPAGGIEDSTTGGGDWIQPLHGLQLARPALRQPVE